MSETRHLAAWPVELAADFIEQWEGFRETAYRCPAGVLTIGFGHTGSDVKKGQVVTYKEAYNMLLEDLKRYASGLAAWVNVKVTEGQYIALLSLAFNVGVGAVAKSTLLRLLNAGDIEAAGDEFLKWTYAAGRELPGLVRRRREERKLFLGEE
jgi:lysozyme